MLFEKVKVSLRDTCLIQPQDKLVVGVSGGADSMALLDLLVRCNYKPLVAHFNHQLRPAAAQDAEFVRRRVSEYGLPFVLGSADVGALAQASGQGIEEAARGARYRFLFATAEEQGAAALAVAHQADDQVETVLMNLLRGSGLNGLSGMRFRSSSAFHDSIPLVRPLLGCWREDILAYCRENELAHVEDESNQDSSYRRNRVRLELLPMLESYNPQVKPALQRMASLLADDADFIQEATSEAVAKVRLQSRAGYAALDLNEFGQLSPSLQRNLIRFILRGAFPSESDLGALHFELAREILARETDTLNLQLNDSILVRVENERGVLMQPEDADKASIEWPNLENAININVEPGITMLSQGLELAVEIVDMETLGEAYLHNEDNFSTFLDVDKLAAELKVRTWNDGDRYQPLGMEKGEQILSDFWVNHKVPLRAKRHWPLFFSGDVLVWVPGFPPSQQTCLTAETRRVLKLRLYRVEDQSSVK
jgi:tRNA(Ile)-lysidine synthase